MFKNLTYKRKFQLLLGVSALLTIFVYQSVISKTVDLYKKNRELNSRLTEAASTPASLATLTRQLSSMDQLIQAQGSDTSENVHDQLLSYLSSYCKEKKTVLKSFPQPFSSNEGEFELQTHTFAVEGNFVSLLQMVYLLEQKLRLGKISSVDFQSYKDPDTKRTILSSTVYLQNIKKVK